MIVSRPCSGFSHPHIGIEDIFHARFTLFGQCSSGINIVRCELRIYFRFSIHAVGNDYRHVFASYIADSLCLTTRGRQIIKLRCLQSWDIRMFLPQQDVIHQFTGNRDFGFGSLAQRYTNGISQTVGQQCADTQGGFDTSVFTVSGFRHSEMQRESHAFLFHDSDQQPDGLYHYDRIGGLYRNDNIREMFFNTDTKKFHAGFYHSFRSIAVARHDTVGQRSMVHPDTDSSMILFADIQERDKTVTDFLYFLRILFVCIFQFLKSTRSIYVVARINPHLLGILSRHISYLGIEMHIGNQRHHVPLTAQADIDVHQIFGLLDALRCQADILATRIHNSLGLVHTSLCILRRRVGHRLDTNRIGAAQRYSPNIYFCGFSSKIIE